MKHGNLANSVSTTIGFRCIDFLVEFQEGGIKNALLNTLQGKYKRAKINPLVLNVMTYLYRQTEHNVDLVVERKDYTEELKELIADLPFNRIVIVERIQHVSMRLMTGDLTYYVDNDKIRLNLINNEYAVSLEDLNNHLRLG